jgi:hypothetical protein
MKHTKLQKMLGLALDQAPDSSDVSAVIDATATWFEYVLNEIGLTPTCIPTLLRWQYLQGELLEEEDE